MPGKIRHSKWMRRACEVASKTVEPSRRAENAKDMSFGKCLRPAHRWIGSIHPKRRGNGGNAPKIPCAWEDSAQQMSARRAFEVASKTVEPSRRAENAKGMPLGNGFARRAAGLGRFIRSAAGMAVMPRKFHTPGKNRHSKWMRRACEVASKTVEPSRWAENAKDMSLGNGFARRTR